MSKGKLGSAADLKELRDRLTKKRDPKKTMIFLCGGTGCQACGCGSVLAAFQAELKKDQMENKVEIKTTGCHGFCEHGPVVVIEPLGILYQKVSPNYARLIWEHTIKNGKPVEELLYRDLLSKQTVKLEKDVPFYKKQTRLVMGAHGTMDPTAIDDYVAQNGYQAAAKALAMKPEAVIDEITKSGLRGRGGWAQAIGKEWAACRAAKGDAKYVIGNADQDAPVALIDRAILEGNPHAIIEGLLIGAFAIGAKRGFVCVRTEYTRAIANLTAAIKSAREQGLLGENILGSGFGFDIEIFRGGGAFVSGDSSSMYASMEGKVGEPRARYIHTVENGLWDKPTNANQIETWANVPMIINKGAAWFSGIGTKASKGTKVFSLTGKVANAGVVEVAMGVPLREVIGAIGGGVKSGKKLKAVQLGSPNGGALLVDSNGSKGKGAVNILDLPLDFDEFAKAGASLKSGELVIMDEDSCMVDMARHQLDFLRLGSCGKCTPCREGIVTMIEILDRIIAGNGTRGDLDRLEELAQVVADSSLCQFGQGSANPVLSSLSQFREEYQAHIVDKRCPAGVCKNLASHAIDESCTGCHDCGTLCPTKAISGNADKLHVINQEKCNQCGACFQICRYDSIKRVKRGEGDKVQARAKELWKPPTQKAVAEVA
jgi:NADH-quinone oxidoreductase subunit F